MKTLMLLIVSVVLMSSNAFAWTDYDNMSPEQIRKFHQVCPFGDAVMVNKADPSKTAEVDCVNLDKNKYVWITWKVVDGKKVHMSYPTDQWDAFTMDYQLIIKDGKLYKEKTYNRQEDIERLDKMIQDAEAERKVSMMIVSPLF